MLLVTVLLFFCFSHVSECMFHSHRTGSRYPVLVMNDDKSIYSPNAEYRRYIDSSPWDRWHSIPTSRKGFLVKLDKPPPEIHGLSSFPWNKFSHKYPFLTEQLRADQKSELLSKLRYYQIQPISHYKAIPFISWRELFSLMKLLRCGSVLSHELTHINILKKPCISHQLLHNALPHRETVLAKNPYKPNADNAATSTSEPKTNILSVVNENENEVSKVNVAEVTTLTSFISSTVTEESDLETSSHVLPDPETSTVRPNSYSTGSYDYDTDLSDITTESYPNEIGHTKHPTSNFPEILEGDFEIGENVSETTVPNLGNTISGTSTDLYDSNTDSNIDYWETSENNVLYPEIDDNILLTTEPDVGNEANNSVHGTQVSEDLNAGNTFSSEYYYLWPETTTSAPTEYSLETSTHEVDGDNSFMHEDLAGNVSEEISGHDTNLPVTNEYISSLSDAEEENLYPIQQNATTNDPDYYEFLPETTNIYDLDQSTITDNHNLIDQPTELYYEIENVEETTPELPEYEFDSIEEETNTQTYTEHSNSNVEDALEYIFHETLIPTTEAYDNNAENFPTESGIMLYDNLDSGHYHQSIPNVTEIKNGELYHGKIDTYTNLLKTDDKISLDEQMTTGAGLFDYVNFLATSNEKAVEIPLQWEHDNHNGHTNDMKNSFILNSDTSNSYDFEKDFSNAVTLINEDIFIPTHSITTDATLLVDDALTKHSSLVHESNLDIGNSQHDTYEDNAANEEKSEILEQELLPNGFKYSETGKLKTTNSMGDLGGEGNELQNLKLDQSEEQQLIGNSGLANLVENGKFEGPIRDTVSDEILEDFKDEGELEDIVDTQMVELVDEEALEKLEDEITVEDLQDEISMEEMEDNISTDDLLGDDLSDDLSSDDLRDDEGLKEVASSGEVGYFNSADDSNDEKSSEYLEHQVSPGNSEGEGIEDELSGGDFDGKMPVDDWEGDIFAENLGDEILDADFAGKEASFTENNIPKQTNLLIQTPKNPVDYSRRSDILIEDDNSDKSPIFSRKRRNILNLQEMESKQKKKISLNSKNLLAIGLQSNDDVDKNPTKSLRVKRTFGTLFGGGLTDLLQQNQGSFLNDVILKPLLRRKYNYLRKKQLLVRMLARFLDLENVGSMPFRRSINEKDYDTFDSDMIFNLPKTTPSRNDDPYGC